MFSFQWPWLVIFLPFPWLVRYFWPLWREESSENKVPYLRLPTTWRVRQTFPKSLQTTPDYLKQRELLQWLCWVGLTGALMYPQWLDKHVQVTQIGYDLMLAVDLSGSMETPDFSTSQGETMSRLRAVKKVLGPFIQHRVGDRIGLILFADHAYLQAPLTLDNKAVYSLLEKAMLGMAGRETAIGEAMGLGIKKLKERPDGSRVLILLTDGDNNAGNLSPLKAAQLAKEYHVRLYTIGVGSTGNTFREGVNEKLLKQIASLTGGSYFSATDFDALTKVYEDIDRVLQKTQAESRIYLQHTSLYHWPLGIAMLALLALQLLRIYTQETR